MKQLTTMKNSQKHYPPSDELLAQIQPDTTETGHKEIFA